MKGLFLFIKFFLFEKDGVKIKLKKLVGDFLLLEFQRPGPGVTGRQMLFNNNW